MALGADQLGGHDGKKLGDAKEKSVEDPKPLPEGNVHPEGHTAGGNKFQDGSTMGREEKFQAHEVTKDEVLGMIIMGKKPGEVTEKELEELHS
jgi:hypothetical protein